jgi:hypothetical protein
MLMVDVDVFKCYYLVTGDNTKSKKTLLWAKSSSCKTPFRRNWRESGFTPPVTPRAGVRGGVFVKPRLSSSRRNIDRREGFTPRYTSEKAK